MNIVVDIIAEYLCSNRRLVVPTFGAFMVKENGERLFSDLFSEDDGVLVALLRGKGLSEMEAAIMLDRFIFEMRHELEQYGYYRLNTIGTLRVEPTTKIVKLYPPVQSEVPLQEAYEIEQKPYVPQPIVEPEPAVEVRVVEEKTVPNPQPETKKEQVEELKPQKTLSIKPQPRAKRRRGTDFVLILAVLIVVAALAVIGYGWYVSNLAEGDDAAMDALRVTPEQTIN